MYVDGTPQQRLLLYNRLDVEIPSSSSTVTTIPLGGGGLISIREPIEQQVSFNIYKVYVIKYKRIFKKYNFLAYNLS